MVADAAYQFGTPAYEARMREIESRRDREIARREEEREAAMLARAKRAGLANGQESSKTASGADLKQSFKNELGSHLEENYSDTSDPPPRPRLRPIPFGDIKLGTAPRYLVKGWIPSEGLVIVWGAPKCGKSFWVFDVVMHVALGWEYRGCKVRPGPVVYIAAEGQTGFQARIEAFRQAKMSEDAKDAPFYLIPDRITLTDDYSALEQEIRAALKAGAETNPVLPAAIVIDTLNRSFTGSESSDQDMTTYIQAADHLRAAFSCAVLIVHHCGHEGGRPRGHTALMGAADAQISIVKQGKVATASVDFMKDGPDDAALAFELFQIVVGNDDDGDGISSCIVEPVDKMPAGKPKKLPGDAQSALEALSDLINENPLDGPAHANGAPCARFEDWKNATLDTLHWKAKSKEAAKRAWTRVPEKLKGHIGHRDGLVWVLPKPLFDE